MDNKKLNIIKSVLQWVVLPIMTILLIATAFGVYRCLRLSSKKMEFNNEIYFILHTWTLFVKFNVDDLGKYDPFSNVLWIYWV